MRLYFKFLSLNLKIQMQYKSSFFLLVISQFMNVVFMFLSVKFMFLKFNNIVFFSYKEVLFCFAVINFSFSLAKCVSEGLNTFSISLSNFEFDRLLVRPRNSLFQVIISKLDLHQIGSFTVSIIILLYSCFNFNWNFFKIFVLISMLISGVFVFVGLSIISAAICFFLIKDIEFINLFIFGGREFGRFPLAIYGRHILNFFTYIVPIALFQYYPLLFLTDKDNSIINAFCPLMCILFFILCVVFWNMGVKKYKSVGS